jgi:hypothetical protein
MPVPLAFVINLSFVFIFLQDFVCDANMFKQNKIDTVEEHDCHDIITVN